MQPFEEYQLFFEHIHQLSDRRQEVTTTYLSVNSAIVGAVVFIFSSTQLQDWGKQLSAIGLLLAGILACDFWRRLISHYSLLTSWWYAQLRALEMLIPESQQLVTREYNELYVGRGALVKGLGKYETRLAWLFTGIYLLAIAAVLVMLALPLFI